MTDRKRKIVGLQALVDRYPDTDTAPAAPPATESVMDTLRRTKRTLIDKPYQGLRIKQRSKARQWGRAREEIQGILRD